MVEFALKFIYNIRYAGAHYRLCVTCRKVFRERSAVEILDGLFYNS